MMPKTATAATVSRGPTTPTSVPVRRAALRLPQPGGVILRANLKAVRPGQQVSIFGSGFLPDEQVTLALDGEALPSTVLTDRAGRFSVRLPIPSTLSGGTNSLSAFGITSLRVALISINGLVVGTTAYFAGGKSSADSRARIDLLNATNQVAGARLTFYFQSSETGGPYTLIGRATDFAVNGSAGTMTLHLPSANRAAYLPNIMATDVDEVARVAIDKRASGSGQYVYELARSNIEAGNEYRGKLRVDPAGTVHIQATKVLHNVETNLGTEVAVRGLRYRPGTYLWMRLQVRGTMPTILRLKAWLAGEREPTTWQYSTIDTESRLRIAGTVGVRAYLSGKSKNAPVRVAFSALRITSTSNIVLVSDTFKRRVADGWEGSAVTTARVTVGAHAERNVSVSDLTGRDGDFGLVVEANRALVAGMTTIRAGRDGDTLLGTPNLSKHWYLAEGYTGLTFRETVNVLNPGALRADVQLKLLPSDHSDGRSVMLTVPPRTERSLDVNSLLPSRSLSIIATASEPVVVERTLAFGTGGYGLTQRTGAISASSSWLFAEGVTVNHFQTFVTVLNPGAVNAHVVAHFYGAHGYLGARASTVAPLSRATLKLNDVLSTSGVATVLTSDRPVVVERSEYFGSPNALRVAGSGVFGRNGAAGHWAFPGGQTTAMPVGGSASTREFILFYNPAPGAATIEVTFFGSDGRTVTKRLSVAPHTRYTLDVNHLVPGVTGLHGVVARVTNGHGVVVEQTVFTVDHTTLSSTPGSGE